MSNVSYQIESVERGIVTVLETFDLTNRNGPGFLTRYGQIVDVGTLASEGIVSAGRRFTMTEQQAFERGLIVRD